MAIFAILSFLLGAVLGHRFKVMILLPTIAVGAIAAIAFGIARADDIWLIGLAVTLFSVCLQIGYLCGTVMVALAVATRATRIRERKFRVQASYIPVGRARLGHARSVSADPYDDVGCDQ